MYICYLICVKGYWAQVIRLGDKRLTTGHLWRTAHLHFKPPGKGNSKYKMLPASNGKGKLEEGHTGELGPIAPPFLFPSLLPLRLGLTIPPSFSETGFHFVAWTSLIINSVPRFKQFSHVSKWDSVTCFYTWPSPTPHQPELPTRESIIFLEVAWYVRVHNAGSGRE